MLSSLSSALGIAEPESRKEETEGRAHDASMAYIYRYSLTDATVLQRTVRYVRMI